MARVVAVAVGWYALAALVIGSALRRSGAGRLVRLADLVTPTVLRRLLAATATVSLVGIGPVTASTTTTTRITATTAPDDDVPVMRLLPPSGATTTSLPSPAGPGQPAGSSPPLAELPPPGPAPPDRWTVSPGQCFWTIADAVLTRATGRPPTDAEIVPYWLRLIEANGPALHDPANADLIFPGQVFTLPTPA